MSKKSVQTKDNVADICPYVVKVLDALQHPNAWVSDSTAVRDFIPTDAKQSTDFLGRASIKLGFLVHKNDYVMDLAKKLQEKDAQV